MPNDPNIITTAPNIATLIGDTDIAGSAADLSNRARGAMLGLGVGNLMGLPVESQWHDTIAQWYPNGITDIDPREANRPMDDDLAQAVDLAESLVGGGDYISDFAQRLITWADENGRGMGFLTSRVINELRRNAPPDAARIVYEQRPIAPNGGVMRCAPAALARFRQPELLVSDSAATCAVTHYAAACQWSCIIINAVIARLLRGAAPDLPALLSAAAADGAPELLQQSQRDGIPSDILAAIAAGHPVAPDCAWLRQDQRLIGHTLLAMQAGLWGAATPLDFESALREVVESGGDTDTNGAVAGAALGARYGASAIPQRWLDCIPQRGRIENLADKLLALSGESATAIPI